MEILKIDSILRKKKKNERNQNTDFKTSRKLVFPSIDIYSFPKGAV